MALDDGRRLERGRKRHLQLQEQNLGPLKCRASALDVAVIHAQIAATDH